MVLFWHNRGTSQRKLAKMFSVSKRLIQFIIFPEKLKKSIQARLDRGGSMQYYNKEKNKKYMKKHRNYKHNILKHTLNLKNENIN